MQLQVGATEKPIFPNNYNKTVYYQIKKLNLIYNIIYSYKLKKVTFPQDN